MMNVGVLRALARLMFVSELNVDTSKVGRNFELDAVAAGYIRGVFTVYGAIRSDLIMGNIGISILGIGVDEQ